MMHRRTIFIGLAALAGSGLAAPRQAKQAGAAPERVREVEQAIEAWRLAWELGEPDMYLRFYEPGFKGRAVSRAQWERQRRARLAREKITIKVDRLRIALVSDTEADVRFVQRYSAGGHRDVGEKHLRMRRSGGAWRITQESWKRRGA